MKKKFVAVAMAATLALGSVAAIHATVPSQPSSTTAGITFEAWVYDGVFDPGDEGTIPGLYGEDPVTGDPIPGLPAEPDTTGPGVFIPPTVTVPDPGNPGGTIEIPGNPLVPDTTGPGAFLPPTVNIPDPNGDPGDTIEVPIITIPDGDGTINVPWYPGTPPTPPIIPPGTLPPSEEGQFNNMLAQFGTIGLEFGTRDIPTVTTTFSSLDYSSDVNALTIVGAEPNTADLAIVAMAAPEWHVSVRMGTTPGTGQFRLVSDNSPTLPNYRLNLAIPVADANLGANPRTITGGAGAISLHATGAASLTGGLNYTGNTFRVASGRSGIFGARFEGLLTVPAFSADAGRAQADIVWTLVHEFPNN